MSSKTIIYFSCLLLVCLLNEQVQCGNITTRVPYRYRNRLAKTSTVSTTASTSTTTESSTVEITTTVPLTTTTTQIPRTWKKVCGAKNGEIYPWIAILEHSHPTQKGKKKTLSKGVLITDQYVLTTVSSIHNSHPFWVVTKVRLGEFMDTLGRKNVSERVSVNVDDIFLHNRRDIALIKLQKPVNLTSYIRPICLPKSQNYNFREMYFHVCRKNEFSGRRSYSYQTVPVSPLTPQDCSTLFHRKTAEFSVQEEFCAWDERGDTCYGDLGGPLMGIQDGRYQVIGLGSYARYKKVVKDDDLPGIYTRVGAHIDWINTIIAKI
ncbi:CLIP domain-containing serine protease 14D-like [Sergentomyia squamirostris]